MKIRRIQPQLTKPFKVHRSSTLYQACSLALGLPTHVDRNLAKNLTNHHLVHITLSWAFSTGSYNPAVVQESTSVGNWLSFLLQPHTACNRQANRSCSKSSWGHSWHQIHQPIQGAQLISRKKYAKKAWRWLFFRFPKVGPMPWRGQDWRQQPIWKFGIRIDTTTMKPRPNNKPTAAASTPSSTITILLKFARGHQLWNGGKQCNWINMTGIGRQRQKTTSSATGKTEATKRKPQPTSTTT